MHNALLGIIATLGVIITVFMLVRIIRSVRANAPRDQVLGYFAVMIASALVSVLLMRML